MSTSTVDVCGKRSLEYVADCLAKFNRGAEEIKIRAIGGNVAKGVRVAQILDTHFDNVFVKNTQYEKFDSQESCTAGLAITLKCQEKGQYGRDNSVEKILEEEGGWDNFRPIIFLIYHLLFDNLINKVEKVTISVSPTDEKPFVEVLKIKKNRWGIDIAPSILDQTKFSSNKNLNSKLIDELIEIYYRSGLLIPPNWENVANRVAAFDDIILGVDTNVLLHASLCEHLLNSLYLINPRNYINTPNWMLIVIPDAVMHELEQSTNSRKNGLLDHIGRKGFRALGEIFELSQCVDLAGISLIVVGESNPVLDIRVELRELRKLLADGKNSSKPKDNNTRESKDKNFRKSSSGDAFIRGQFKSFIQKINFYRGGVFFLTSDKTCAALAHAEGLHPIYYQIPATRELMIENYQLKMPSEKIKIFHPAVFGKLIYECAVQFGDIKIAWNTPSRNEVSIKCDCKGNLIDHWFHKNLFISTDDAKKLLALYQEKFQLSSIRENVWKKLQETLVKKDLY